MFGIPWTKLLLGAFVGYMAYTMYTMYSIFMPQACTKGQQCIQAYLATKPKLGVSIHCNIIELYQKPGLKY